MITAKPIVFFNDSSVVSGNALVILFLGYLYFGHISLTLKSKWQVKDAGNIRTAIFIIRLIEQA
jgi:hypothetical protein